MKKILPVFLLIISFNISAQVELKGVQLLTKDSRKKIKTTVGGIKGIIALRKNNNDTVYGISFIPTEDGIIAGRVYETEINILKKGLEKKFDIKFNKEYTSNFAGSNYNLIAKKDDVIFTITVNNNPYEDPPNKIGLFIYNTVFLKKVRKEIKEDALKDF